MKKGCKRNQEAKQAFDAWQFSIEQNIYLTDKHFQHSIQYYFEDDFPQMNESLAEYGERVVKELIPLVVENNRPENLPRLESFNRFGKKINDVVHHPSYISAGNIIYGANILKTMASPGGLLKALSFFYLCSQAGEAGHNCPLACTAGIINVFNKVGNFKKKNEYYQTLIEPSYENNFTGAQFVTEIQGGSDVGQSEVYAEQDTQETWKLYGEKWFCSNVDANLFLVIARYDENIEGTKGLALFLVPSELEDGKQNFYEIKRLKDKLGTCSMATGEIEFEGAVAYPMGELKKGFHLLMENVLHTSRYFNALCVVAMARRAYEIAWQYAKNRIAFNQPILHFPLIKEHLATIKAENSLFLTSVFAVIQLQDEYDQGKTVYQDLQYLLRFLVNGHKYLTALKSVEHIHHCIDILAGNGVIETFSSLPRLLRDSIICENWEGTHNVLRMQILKDLFKYNLDEIYYDYMEVELAKIQNYKETVKRLSNILNEIKDSIDDLKQTDQNTQTLKIKYIIDDMIILFGMMHLLREGIHQEIHLNAKSKLDCLEFVFLSFSNHGRCDYGKEYVELIDVITSDL